MIVMITKFLKSEAATLAVSTSVFAYVFLCTWALNCLVIEARSTQSQPDSNVGAEVEQLNSNLGSFFTENGFLAVTSSFGHLHFPFSMSHLRDRISYVEEIYGRLADLNLPAQIPANEKAAVQKRLDFVKAYLRYTVKRMQARYEEVQVSFGETTGDRQPRQIIAMTIAAVVGGAVGGTAASFTQEEMADVVNNEETVLSETVGENILSISQNSRDIQMLNRTIELLETEIMNEFKERQKLLEFEHILLRSTTMISILEKEFADVIDVLFDARHGRVHPAAMPGTAIHDAFRRLNSKAVQRGFELGARTPEDLSMLPATAVYNPANRTMHVIVHAALYQPGAELRLYHYIAIPQKTNLVGQNNEAIYSEISPENPWLAVSKDSTTYIILSNEDLQECKLIQANYRLCPQQVAMKSKARSCLFSLYSHAKTAIQETCDSRVSARSSKLTRIAANKWLTFESTKRPYEFACPSISTKRVEVEGHAIITLGEGCVCNTPEQVFGRPRYEANIYSSNHFAHFELPSPNEIVNLNFESDEAEDLVRSLLGKVGKPVETTQVQNWIDFNRRMNEAKKVPFTFSLPHFLKFHLLPNLTSTLAVIGFIVMTYRFGPAMIRCLTRRRRHVSARRLPNVPETEPLKENQYNLEQERARERDRADYWHDYERARQYDEWHHKEEQLRSNMEHLESELARQREINKAVTIERDKARYSAPPSDDRTSSKSETGTKSKTSKTTTSQRLDQLESKASTISEVLLAAETRCFGNPDDAKSARK